ncbi:MAG: aminotransferase class IV family protein [Sulfuricurvum sp.]
MLLETLRCEEGIPLHLPYHQQRMERSLRALGSECRYRLEALIAPPAEGIYRCRVLYDAESIRIEYHPYVPRVVSSLKIIRADDLDYRLKYADRSRLNELFEQRGECDDVLIVRNGFLTDTTIANVALRIGGRWLTPEAPLLEGTTRARLIEEGFVTPAPLRPDDIAKSDKTALMNVMMGFVEVENGIIS